MEEKKGKREKKTKEEYYINMKENNYSVTRHEIYYMSERRRERKRAMSINVMWKNSNSEIF
jgi:hypothetical protein